MRSTFLALSALAIALVQPAWTLPQANCDASKMVARQAAAQNKNIGIAYSPFSTAVGVCKPDAEIMSDIEKLKNYGYIRIYNNDCDIIRKIYPGLKAKGQRLYIGIYEPKNVDAGVKSVVGAIGGDWSAVHTINVGNEHVADGKISPADLCKAVQQAKTQLSAAGYKGPVTTVDVFNQFYSHPELCNCGDYVGANMHPFFDQNIEAARAGDFVKDQLNVLKQKCPGKKIVVTETGWPNAGGRLGKAVAGRQQHIDAMKSIMAVTKDQDVTYFSGFDEKWKPDNEKTAGVEKHWGMVQLL
ncbi:glycoside hydrolase superfamily [Phlyctochytrium arcticum]|nr:glycoside hydrolase superfamily [Phlyctochytrium arcticum]